MKFELVHENARQRFYKSNTEIKVFPIDNFNWDEELKSSKSNLKEGWSMIDDKCFYVCVSDASTHIERLVFAAGRFQCNDGSIEYGRYSSSHIDGNMTFMTYGGNPDLVKDDLVYLRHISIKNTKKNEN